MTEIVTGRRALVLGLALLLGACAANGSLLDPDDLYQSFDSNNDGNLTPQEWNDAFWKLDTNGDGIVTRDEWGAALGGGP
jgi:EF hand